MFWRCWPHTGRQPATRIVFRVLYYRAFSEAKLIQRMFIWRKYGCVLREDPEVSKRTRGKPGAILYYDSREISVGFFASVRYLESLETEPVKPAKGRGAKKKTSVYVPITREIEVPERGVPDPAGDVVREGASAKTRKREEARGPVKVKPKDPFAGLLPSGPGF